MQTKKQDLTNKIKHFIEEYYGQYGTSPSIRCIAENVGCSKSNVTIYIDYLKEQGLLEIGEGGYETEVTRATETNVVAVPRLGYVPCGPLSEEYECIDGYVRLPASFVGNAKKCFLLTACGNSMIDAGIHDGDLVLVRQQETANYNDIVVALVDNRGLHDAMITKISFHPLDYDFTKPKPIRNFILIELDSSNALFDTHIKTIKLYNAKIVAGTVDASGYWWVTDELISNKNSYTLTVQIRNRKEKSTIIITFDDAEVL